MNAMTQEQFGLADLLRFVGTDLAEIGAGDVLKREHGATAGPQRSPGLRGAAYVAALKGDPWRPYR